MRYFPIFIDLADDQLVLVYGGNEDAARKVRLLLKSRVVINIVAGALNDELAGMVKDGRIAWVASNYSEDQLDAGPRAVFGAADEDTNQKLSQAARRRGVPVNIVDDAELSTFIVPAIVDRDPLVVAIGTGGAGPVLAQGLRARIEAMLPTAFGGLLNQAGRLRETVAEHVPAGACRRAFWRDYFFGAPRRAFVAGNEAGFAQALENLLAASGSTAADGHIALIDVNADPDLITLKAHRLLQEADIIIHDATVSRHVLEFSRRDALRHKVVTSCWSSGPVEHKRTAATLLKDAETGCCVVRLYDADASVLDGELFALAELNINSIVIDHVRSAPDERNWTPLIDGQTVDGSIPWRLAS